MSIEGIDAAVAQFVGQVEPADRRDDCETLVAVMSQVTGDTAALWGSIVGFGRYHYR